MIINGKYKNTSLVNVVQDTSKEIVDLFYNGKEGNREKSVMEEKMGQPVDSSVPMSFITGYEQQE